MLKRRLLPSISGGRRKGSPWIHVEDAAAGAVAALYNGCPGESYNIADDTPARFSDFVEHLARVIGAPGPLTIPIGAAVNRPIYGSDVAGSNTDTCQPESEGATGLVASLRELQARHR